MIHQGKKNYPVTEVILHCSATAPEWMKDKSLEAKVEEITNWHKARGWKREGYHWFIDRDGKLAKGRPMTMIGAHCKERNRGTIGVCLLGGHGSSATDRFEENFTPAQRKATWALLKSISEATDLRTVTGHNRYAAKACPGFDVPIEFPWPEDKPDEGVGSMLGQLLERVGL